MSSFPFNLWSLSIITSILLASCQQSEQKHVGTSTDSLTEGQRHLPENALKGLSVANGLVVQAMATEPMLINPTNIDVDERGRVWVTEAYNYRPAINNNPTRQQGDRIVILEDLNADGVMDTGKVFYQGPEINAPLGVCVLDNKVIVSQSPFVWVFYDDNRDDKADRKEILFQGIGGEQHDHGVHAFIFGPDGKLYFNFGNEGKQLKDKAGRVVRDQDNELIDEKKYTMGMVFRSNPDGTSVECLGYNFRNNYEIAVDSYGAMWQSDNDDDGNKSTRINYVMDYGNYGFTDEVTGAGWQASRTNMEDSIPARHWHQNDPGVVPNLLITGAGSPTGMVIYEGTLLPQQFRNQMIHCDAGPNVVRAYSVKNRGAGYEASIIDILKGDDDPWFRPADICVAPDGSLIVADWYDPGVGGHAAGDQQRGRIYRVAPGNSKYVIPKFDYASPEGAILALKNPNLAVRYKAWMALQQLGDTAIPALDREWKSQQDQRMRARVFWALVKNPKGKGYVMQAVKDPDPNIRMMGLRAARQLGLPVVEIVKSLVDDSDAQVRRECAIALRHVRSTEAAQLWARLAKTHDGVDRWYLEALGIGADRQWDSFFGEFLKQVANPHSTAAGRDIVWRARTDKAIPYLAQLASGQEDLKNRLRYFRAFDFNEGPAKTSYLLAMIKSPQDTAFNKIVLRHLNVSAVKGSKIAREALTEVLRATAGTPAYLDLVRQYREKTAIPSLLDMAIEKSDDALGRSSASLLLDLGGQQAVWDVVNGGDTARIRPLIKSIGRSGTKAGVDILQKIILSEKYAPSIRSMAALNIGRSGAGEDRVLQMLKMKTVPQNFVSDVVKSVEHAWRQSVRTEAASYLPNSPIVKRKDPAFSDLSKLTPNSGNGQKVYDKVCAQCHVAKNSGFDFGPKLSEIGSKLPKEAQLAAILRPSEGISFGYEGWEVKLKDGSTLTGIITSKTEQAIDMKFPGGGKTQIKTSEVQSMKQLKQSLMPEGLHYSISDQELADLLEFLDRLKK